MASFWGHRTKLDFHKTVADLHDITRYPVGEVSYCRDFEDSEIDTHVLKLREELQLADDLAFLANSDEGNRTVSAVTIQEGNEGITILLASNSTPTERTTKGLRKILSTIKRYASRGTNSSP